MKRTVKQTISVCLSLVMVITSLVAGSAEAKGKATLKSKKMTLTVGQSKKITMKGKKAKAKYTFSSSAKAKATVSKKGVVKARKVGKATITVKEKYKKKTRKVGKVAVTIQPKQSEATPTPTATSGVTPTSTATQEPTGTPTAEPTATPTRQPTPTPFQEDPDMAVPGSMVMESHAGEIETFTYESTAISEGESIERRAIVVLPVGYKKTKKYPVVYALHGYNGAEISLAGDGTRAGDGAQYITWNAYAGDMAESVILVCPNVNANKSGVQEVGAYDNFINDLIPCLMPAIEKNYPVLTGRENTAIWGFSMGGRESLMIGLSRPDLFGYIGAFCPAPGVPDEMFKLPEEYANNTLIIIAKGANDASVGDVPIGYHNALTKANIPHIYYETLGFGNGGHSRDVFLHGYYNLLVRAFPGKEMKK